MPTFTAIALDRLLEPGASKSMESARNVPDSKLERRNGIPNSRLERGSSVPILKPERRNSISTMTSIDRKHRWTQISPALYATPKSTPLPDSPSSFPPSPYIINHKRRGPRLLKSFSVDDVASRQKALDEEKEAENAKIPEREVAGSADNAKGAENAKIAERKVVDSANNTEGAKIGEREGVDSTKDVGFMLPVPSPVEVEYVNNINDRELGSSKSGKDLAGQSGTMKFVTFDLEQSGEAEDFFDLQESMSVKSNTEGESNGGVERSLNLTTPMAEYYDAWEELSSEGGPQLPVHDVEAELREIRLSLLMEIEKRKQAEETLDYMRSKWQRIRQQLSLVGLKLPADPITAAEDGQLDDPAEELCQQVYLARFVSNSIGRGTAKAEVEMEMEAQLESKNFEMARLWDRLHYYEAVNREMSQRNQEAVETARRHRQRSKRSQRWIWGWIAATITLGTAALAWSYFPPGKGSSFPNQSHEPEGGDHTSK